MGQDEHRGCWEGWKRWRRAVAASTGAAGSGWALPKGNVGVGSRYSCPFHSLALKNPALCLDLPSLDTFYILTYYYSVCVHYGCIWRSETCLQESGLCSCQPCSTCSYHGVPHWSVTGSLPECPCSWLCNTSVCGWYTPCVHCLSV